MCCQSCLCYHLKRPLMQQQCLVDCLHSLCSCQSQDWQLTLVMEQMLAVNCVERFSDLTTIRSSTSWRHRLGGNIVLQGWMFLWPHDRPMLCPLYDDHSVRRKEFLRHLFRRCDKKLRRGQPKRLIRPANFLKYRWSELHFRVQPDLRLHRLDRRFLDIGMQSPSENSNH